MIKRKSKNIYLLGLDSLNVCVFHVCLFATAVIYLIFNQMTDLQHLRSGFETYDHMLCVYTDGIIISKKEIAEVDFSWQNCRTLVDDRTRRVFFGLFLGL